VIRLGVNIDHIATMRQARYRGTPTAAVPEPDPLSAAQICLEAGAHAITVHLREDRRHIQDDDVFKIAERYRDKLNLEMAATPAMLDLALKIRPAEVCLVPENRTEVTTEGGLDAHSQKSTLLPILKKLREVGILTSLFIDPDPKQIETSAYLQAPVVELHTGRFADAGEKDRPHELNRLVQVAKEAYQQKIQVNAGHGLRLSNLPSLLSVPHLHTLNIGHSLVSHALTVGLNQSVKDFLQLIQKG